MEKVEVPPYPDITRLLLWKTSLVRAVVIAANNFEVAAVVNWLQEAWACGQTYEALGDTGSFTFFVTLDMKIAQAMVRVMNRAGDYPSATLTRS